MTRLLGLFFFALIISAQYIPPGGGGGGAPTGAAGGSLAGTYPNPSLATLAQDLLFTDATYDMGKLGATRPRDGFFSRNLNVGNIATIGNTVVLDGTTNGLTTASKIGGVTLSGLSGPAKFNGASGPSVALAADMTALFSGSCPSGATCALASDGTKQTVAAFPYAYQRGSIIAVGFNLDNSASRIVWPFGNTFNLPAGCASNSAQYWHMPIGGFVRNITGTTGITNATSPIRWAISPNCMYGAALAGPGPVTTPAASAGGAVDANSADWWHIPQWNPFAMGFLRTGSTNTAAAIHQAVEFVSDDGLQGTVMGQAYAATLTASTTQYLGLPNGGITTTEANVSVPIPIAGTFKNLFVTSTLQPTATVAVNFMKNTVATALTVTIGTTDSGGAVFDATHTASVVAGDLVDIQTISGGSTQAAVQATGVYFTPTSTGETFLWGQWAGATVTTTNKYSTIGTALTGTTIAAMEATMPFACTVSNLYINQAAANAGSTVTTFTLMKNGSATAVTGTANVGVSGSIALDTTHSVSYAQGDLITLQAITNTGTSGAMGGWSAKCL